MTDALLIIASIVVFILSVLAAIAGGASLWKQERQAVSAALIAYGLLSAFVAAALLMRLVDVSLKLAG